jgi:hypothetical protein
LVLEVPDIQTFTVICSVRWMKWGMITRNRWQLLRKEGKHCQTLIATTHCFATVCRTDDFVHKTRICCYFAERTKIRGSKKIHSYFQLMSNFLIILFFILLTFWKQVTSLYWYFHFLEIKHHIFLILGNKLVWHDIRTWKHLTNNCNEMLKHTRTLRTKWWKTTTWYQLWWQNYRIESKIS